MAQSIASQPNDMLKWASAADSVVPGEHIKGTSAMAIPGQGVTKVDDAFVATVAGQLKKVGKIVSVQPTSLHIYEPVTADVVLGRVVKLLPNRWVVDIGALQHATLHIENMNIPGIQRIRDTADESNMRQWLDVGQLIACEIRQGYTLLVRSAQFGVLNHGLLVKAPPCAIGPSTTAFTDIDPLGVHVVIGRNGWIWVSEPRRDAGPRETIRDSVSPTPSEAQMRSIVHTAKLVQLLCDMGERVTPASICAVNQKLETEGSM